MILLNGEPVNVTLFPDNTSQVWKLDDKHFEKQFAMVEWHFSHEGELMQLAQLKNLLDWHTFSNVESVYLYLSYLPYGRQDKPYDNNATFALSSFARIINSLGFAQVTIEDPHSSIALGLIGHSKAVYPHEELRAAILATDSDMIVYPDHGAVSKYVDVYKHPLPYIYGEKVRCQSSGYIESYDLIGDCQGNNVMIVDDICDGGKTFEILAKDLYINGALDINLFVTHGIFSKGLGPLIRAGIDRIFTAKGEAFKMSDGGFGIRPYETT